MFGYDKTSWTTPRAQVVDLNKNKMMIAMYPLNNEVRALSDTEAGKTYNVLINGAGSQLGTDTMKFRYDLDKE